MNSFFKIVAISAACGAPLFASCGGGGSGEGFTGKEEGSVFASPVQRSDPADVARRRSLEIVHAIIKSRYYFNKDVRDVLCDKGKTVEHKISYLKDECDYDCEVPEYFLKISGFRAENMYDSYLKILKRETKEDLDSYRGANKLFFTAHKSDPSYVENAIDELFVLFSIWDLDQRRDAHAERLENTFFEARYTTLILDELRPHISQEIPGFLPYAVKLALPKLIGPSIDDVISYCHLNSDLSQVEEAEAFKGLLLAYQSREKIYISTKNPAAARAGGGKCQQSSLPENDTSTRPLASTGLAENSPPAPRFDLNTFVVWGCRTLKPALFRLVTVMAGVEREKISRLVTVMAGVEREKISAIVRQEEKEARNKKRRALVKQKKRNGRGSENGLDELYAGSVFGCPPDKRESGDGAANVGLGSVGPIAPRSEGDGLVGEISVVEGDSFAAVHIGRAAGEGDSFAAADDIFAAVHIGRAVVEGGFAASLELGDAKAGATPAAIDQEIAVESSEEHTDWVYDSLAYLSDPFLNACAAAVETSPASAEPADTSWVKEALKSCRTSPREFFEFTKKLAKELGGKVTVKNGVFSFCYPSAVVSGCAGSGEPPMVAITGMHIPHGAQARKWHTAWRIKFTNHLRENGIIT